MNTDIAYKSLKYIILWVAIYLVVKYASKGDVSEIDIALIASVLTLLVCIIESMWYQSNSPEGMTNVQNRGSTKQATNTTSAPGVKTQGDMLVSGAMNTSITNKGVANTNSVSVKEQTRPSSSTATPSKGSLNLGDIQSRFISAVTSKLNDSSSSQEDSVSSYSSSFSDGTTPSSNETATIPSTMPSTSVRYLSDKYGNYNDPSVTTGTPVNTMVVADNYLGERVLFDKNEFGGTNQQTSTDLSDTNDETLSTNVASVNSSGIVVPPDAVVTNPYASQYTPNAQNVQKRVTWSDQPAQQNAPSIRVNVQQPTQKNGIPTNQSGQATPNGQINGMSKTSPPTSNGKIIRPDSVIVDNDDVNDPSSASDNAFDDVPETYTKISPSGKPMKWYEQAFNPRAYAGAENLDQIAVSGGRTRNDILVNEMIYSDFNRLPPSFNDKDFEYGYSFLPPKDWYPLPPYPPVCVSNTTSQAQPVYLDTMTMDLKEWHETQKITPPESINTAFITNEMNSKK